MTKKSRKYRKAHDRPTGDTSNASKAKSFSNIFRRKGDFRRKSVDAAIRSCPVNKKQRKNMKKEDPGLPLELQGSSESKQKSEFISLISWKISSVSFFIPLNSHDRGYQEISSETLIDWSDVLFYRCNSNDMLPYPDEEDLKPTELPELRLKRRTVSESSTNSEDSFICFEYDDTYENSHNSNSVNLDERAFNRNKCMISIECEESSSREESEQKKRVRFEDGSQLVTVHLIVAWDYAYRAARVSQWMTMARDAKRFKQKIQSLEPILSPVLNPQHRARIYETRISNDES